MNKKELQNALSQLENVLQKDMFNFNTKKNPLVHFIDKDSKAFREIHNRIESRWKRFQKKNSERILKKTYTTFLNNNFNEFFLYYLNQFFGLNTEQILKLKAKEKVSSRELLLEYNLFIKKIDVNNLQKYFKNSEDAQKGYIFHSYFLFFVVVSLSELLKEIIDEKFELTLEGAKLKEDLKKKTKYIDFLIIVKENRETFHGHYYKMALYFFFRQIKGIPKETLLKLEEGKNELFNFALEKYSLHKTRKRLVDLLYYFYKKCTLLKNISPMLDLINFVNSRVEDSKFSKLDIIKNEYLSNFDYPNGIKGKLEKVFTYLDQKSSTSSTFLANNLPSAVNQANLFLLYNKFYLGSGLEGLEASLLFFPSRFKKKLNNYNSNHENPINSNAIIDINNISNFFSLVSEKDQFNILFQKIFNKQVVDFNYDFFNSFLKSLNEKFLQLISGEEIILSEDGSERKEKFDFSFTMNHICRMIYVLIDKLFLKEDPSEASDNFIDPFGRYVGKNIALRILELELFQDMNFSDDLWPDFLISWNRNKINKKLKDFDVDINISEKHFYTNEQINQLFITYNFDFPSKQLCLEEWLIEDLIEPIHNFIIKIQTSLEDPRNKIEIYEQLGEYFTEGISDEDKIAHIKRLCQKFANFWNLID
ncbi:MAG: hypothetical protein EU547_03600 [Promethearchaeota archaeon]|nr:MAG: hypothetical protein EU547_03600 [Candidatus Lokiarchaeota archaeon]